MAVLGSLRRLVPNFNPRVVMTDYEVGMQNAWARVYNCRVVGCYWHYCRVSKSVHNLHAESLYSLAFHMTIIIPQQAILKKVRLLGLIPAINNRRLRSLIRSVCAVPLLPKALMERGVQTLISEAAQRGFFPLLNDFFEYYIGFWMAPHIKSRLSVFGMKHRTNNVSECSNKLLRSRTGAHRPGLWHFLCKYTLANSPPNHQQLIYTLICFTH